MISVDCFTGWPKIHLMGKNTTADHTIYHLRSLFCRSAAPDVIWSDCGLTFTSAKVQAFLRDWGVCYATSSPTYPQNNGKAESVIKSMKRLIKAAWCRSSIH